MHSVYKMGAYCNRRSGVVCVSVSLLVTFVSPVKRLNRLRCWLEGYIRVGQRNHVLDEVEISHAWKSAILVGLSGQLKNNSITALFAAKNNNGESRIAAASAMLQTGLCLITLSPREKSAPVMRPFVKILWPIVVLLLHYTIQSHNGLLLCSNSKTWCFTHCTSSDWSLFVRPSVPSISTDGISSLLYAEVSNWSKATKRLNMENGFHVASETLVSSSGRKLMPEAFTKVKPEIQQSLSLSVILKFRHDSIPC